MFMYTLVLGLFWYRREGSRTLKLHHQLDEEQEQFEALLEQMGVKDLVLAGGNDEGCQQDSSALDSSSLDIFVAIFSSLLGVDSHWLRAQVLV